LTSWKSKRVCYFNIESFDSIMIPLVWFLNFFYKKYLIDIWNNKKMGMGIRKYPLPGGDGDESKVVYPLGLGMGMGMNFYYGDGIMIPVPAPLRCHPYFNLKKITLKMINLKSFSTMLFFLLTIGLKIVKLNEDELLENQV